MLSQDCSVSLDDSPCGVETQPASLCGLGEEALNQLDPSWILPPLPRCSPQHSLGVASEVRVLIICCEFIFLSQRGNSFLFS